jgi:hypothetical protein
MCICIHAYQCRSYSLWLGKTCSILTHTHTHVHAHTCSNLAIANQINNEAEHTLHIQNEQTSAAYLHSLTYARTGSNLAIASQISNEAEQLLRVENEQLREQLKSAQRNAVDADTIRSENEVLKEQIRKQRQQHLQISGDMDNIRAENER